MGSHGNILVPKRGVSARKGAKREESFKGSRRSRRGSERPDKGEPEDTAPKKRKPVKTSVTLDRDALGKKNRDAVRQIKTGDAFLLKRTVRRENSQPKSNQEGEACLKRTFKQKRRLEKVSPGVRGLP